MTCTAVRYLILIPLLCSCQAFATLERLDRQVAEAIAAGELNDEELRDIQDTTGELQAEVDKALSTATSTASGLLGAGPLADAAGVALLGLAGLNTARNRKYKVARATSPTATT